MADVDWSQFSAEPPAQAGEGVDWSQFSPEPPKAADFSNVQAGTVSRGTLPQLQAPPPAFDLASLAASQPASPSVAGLVEAAAPIAEEIGTGLQGNQEDFKYDTTGKRIIGIPEGNLRSFGREMMSIADMVNPLSTLAKNVTGLPSTGEMAHDALKLNPETETYAGARAETMAELPGVLAANLFPLERLGSVAKLAKIPEWLRGAKKEAALVGDLGPAAQGAAIGDEIVEQALQASPLPKKVPDVEPVAMADSGAARAVAAPEMAGPELPAPRAVPAVPLEAVSPPAPVADAAQAVAPRVELPPLFHGTRADFETFDPATIGSASDTGVFGAGFNATSDARLAKFYPGAKGGDVHVREVEAGLENPKVFKSPQEAIEWQGGRGTDSPEAAAAIRDKYLAEGHDGVVILNNQGKVQDVVAFKPEGFKVKPREAVQTQKTLDRIEEKVSSPTPAPVNASIRESLGLPPKEVPNAGQVRGHQAEVPGERNPIGRSQDLRRQDLQRDAEAGAANLERLRGEGEARNAETPSVTGIKNATVAQERAERGLAAVEHDLARSDPETMRRVKERMEDNPGHGRAVTEDYAQRPRPASKEDAVAIGLDRVRIKNERRAAYDEAELAMQAGDGEKAIAARKRINDLDNQMRLNDQVAAETGHEWAEGGRARQMMFKDDYEMATLVQKARVKKAGSLSEKEMATIEARAKDIEKREKALADHEAKLRRERAKPKSPFAEKDAKKRFDSLVEELKKQPRKVLCEIA